MAGRGFFGTVIPDLYRSLSEKLNGQRAVLVQNDAAEWPRTVLNIYIVLRYIAPDKRMALGVVGKLGRHMKSPENHHLRDFTTDARVLLIAAIAVVVATAGLFAGTALLKLI